VTTGDNGGDSDKKLTEAVEDGKGGGEDDEE
jgi:hypothetical protein